MDIFLAEYDPERFTRGGTVESKNTKPVAETSEQKIAKEIAGGTIHLLFPRVVRMF